MGYCIGIDLGGTNIVSGVVDQDTKQLLHSVSCRTNAQRPWQEIAEDIVRCCYEVTEQMKLSWDQIESVGIGSPGMVDVKQRKIIFAGNLPFRKTPLAEYIQQKLEKPVTLVNDADAAAYGEFVAGAGKGTSSMVAVTLGTGLGTGIIIDSKVYTGFGYAAGEIGHSVLVANGRPCTCGRKGCMEAYISATALIRSTREHMEKNKDSLLWKIADGDIQNVNGKTVFDALEQGDAEAKAVVDEYTYYLSESMINIVNTFQPELICLGGGISKQGDVLLAPVRKAVDTYAFERFAEKRTRITVAQLGNDAGVIGAALLK